MRRVEAPGRYFTAAELVETLDRALSDNSLGRVIDTCSAASRCRREPHPRPMGPGTKMTAAERADLAPDAAFGLTGRLRPIRSYRRSG